jgi:hypothetical protein
MQRAVILSLAPIPLKPRQAAFPINVGLLRRPTLPLWEALGLPLRKRLLRREGRVRSAAPLIRCAGCGAGLDRYLPTPRRMPRHPEFQSITRSNL